LKIEYPTYWGKSKNKSERVELSPSTAPIEYDMIQNMMNNTITETHSTDYKYTKYKMNHIYRLENIELWNLYYLRRDEIIRKNNKNPTPIEGVRTKLLDPLANEYYLFHGLSCNIVDKILESGFDERVSNLAGLFGSGIYFAEDSSKSGTYCHGTDCAQVGAVYGKGTSTCTCRDNNETERCMFVCRVSMGTGWVRLEATSKDGQILRRPPEKDDGSFYDSVIGQSTKFNEEAAVDYREFIVYDRRQCYAEYLIYFSRV